MSAWFNPDVVDTGTPPIPQAKAWLAAYDGRHGPAIDLSQAAPGHPPSDLILNALAAAAADPATAKYGPIQGEPLLREAYAQELNRIYGGSLGAVDSVIVAGCNIAFVMSVMTVARAGDEVILPAPWYFNHKMALDMLGVKAVPLPCRADNGFVADPDAAAALITPRTRAIVLVTPNNPTGAIAPPDAVAAFAALAQKRGIWLVLDETYRDFMPEGQDRPHNLLAGLSTVPDGLIQLYSFSKAYCLPGYRLGAITAPAAFHAQLAKLLDTLQICAPRVGQVALGRVLAETLAWREANRSMIASRAAAFRCAMQRIDGWNLASIGAYFAYVRPSGEGAALAAARRAASDRGVLILPGSYFGPGQENWLRIAFANADGEALAALPERLAGL